MSNLGIWRSLVARVVRDDEVAGSNPVIPTKVKAGHSCPASDLKPKDREPAVMVRTKAVVRFKNLSDCNADIQKSDKELQITRGSWLSMCAPGFF